MKNLQKTVYAFMAATIALSACMNKNKQVVYEDVPDYAKMKEEASIVRDSTFYGICGDGSAMNTLQLITDMGDTVSLSTIPAQEAQSVFGGYSVGDRMAVLLNADSTAARLIVNESMLLGNWVMPNPIDGSDEMGFSIKTGGIVEGIEQGSIIYKTWRFFNGMLKLEWQREGGGDFDEEGYYSIVEFEPDRLVLKDVAEGDLYEYSRQVPPSEREEIKLEDTSFEEDFKM